MTVFIKDRGNDSLKATLPLVLGPKSEYQHDEVVRIIGEDMKKLCKNKILGILGGGILGQWEEVSFLSCLYLSLGDQPERRSSNCLVI